MAKRFERRPLDCIGVADSRLVHIGMGDREAFDKIYFSVHGHGENDNGHVPTQERRRAHRHGNQGTSLEGKHQVAQTFDAFAVGDTIFVPSVQSKEIEVTCPDCLGGKTWTITTASGMSRTIDCPRCNGGRSEYAWMKPKRYERTVVIKEVRIAEVDITVRKAYKSDEIETSIRYGSTPHTAHYRTNEVFRTRQQAEAAGQVLLTEDAKKADERWQQELKRNEERAGLDIIRALEDQAYERAKALDQKIDTLKEKMLDAVRYPYTDGPKLTKRTYGGDELTSQNLADFFSNLLNEAEIDGWSEEELHEVLCHC